jgi:hypothetical protein
MQGFAVANFNQDGKSDILLAAGDKLRIIAAGSLVFSAPLAKGAVTPIAADFNLDGKADAAWADVFFNGGLLVFLGNGDGTLQPSVSYPAGVQPYLIAAADFDGDGAQDIVAANLDMSFSVLRNAGDGSFLPPVSTPAVYYAFSMAAGDANGDGNADLLYSPDNSTAMQLMLGQGDGTFQPPEELALSGSRKGISSFSETVTARLLALSTRWRRRNAPWPSATSPATACRTWLSAGAAVQAAGSTCSPGKATGPSIPRSELVW